MQRSLIVVVLDRLLNQADQEMSDARRPDPMRRQQEIWAEEVPALPLWYRNEEAAVLRGLRGVRPVALRLHREPAPVLGAVTASS